VVFDPRVGKQLLSSFTSAISGSAIARGTSFLLEKMGEEIFSPAITIIDDPQRIRGLASRPFDGEGLPANPLTLVENGILQQWLLSCRPARKLGLASNGRASRGLSSAPSPSSTNLYIQPGQQTPAELIKDIRSGFYVTETFGMGINTVTGDYSQGAAGFWIENGEIVYPVSELTIAGRLQDMFASLTPANDLAFHYRTNTPTLRVEAMTIAGN
jgi:PmbA protein